MAVEKSTDYNFPGRYQHTKSKCHLQRRYVNRHSIPLFDWTPCPTVRGNNQKNLFVRVNLSFQDIKDDNT